MNYLLLIALLPFTFSEKDNYDLKTYNTTLQLAERYLINEQFCNAAEVYQILSADFELWNDDRLNALICALECGDEELVEHFVQLLLDRGATEEIFNVVLSEYEYFQKGGWRSKFNLDSREQRSNNLVSSFIKMDFDNFREKGLKLKEVNEHNYTLLIELVESGNFPTEKHFGFMTRTGEEMSSKEFERVLYRLVEEKPAEFGKLLPQWYSKGYLCKRLFDYLMAWAEPEEKNRLNCKDDTQYFLRLDDMILSCTPAELLTVNLNRAHFYLEPVHDFLKKSLFREKTELPFIIGEKIYDTKTPLSTEYQSPLIDLLNQNKLVEIRSISY